MTVPLAALSTAPAREPLEGTLVDLFIPGLTACLDAVDALDEPLRAEEAYFVAPFSNESDRSFRRLRLSNQQGKDNQDIP